MNSNYIITALEYEKYSKYFEFSEFDLESIGAYIFTSDECPCYPCRVSLEDARVGERVLAISYEHHSGPGPYKSAGPIFIRERATTVTLGKNVIPEMLRHRLLSVRGYDSKSLMIEADTVMGSELESVLSNQLNNNLVSYIHIHNSGPGCFNCSVSRA